MMKLAFTVIGAAFATASVIDDATQAGMFRGGPDHLGVYTAQTNPTLQSVVWKYKTGGRVMSTPLPAGDAVYVGSTDGSLYSLNRSDGSLRWKFQTRGPVTSSPAYSGGVVFAGSVDGKFYAVDAATGKEKWSFTTLGERRFTAPGIHGAIPRTERMPDPFDVFLSSPVIAGGNVYFGSGDTHVYALDAATGALKWKFKTGDVVHASPAVTDGVLYIGSWDRNMYALDAASGRELWRFQTGNDTIIYNQIGIASSAAISNGIVFFGSRDGHFYALDAKSGTEKWKHDNKTGWVIASPAVKDGIVYFPTSDGTRFKAINGATGELVYSVENKAVSFSSPAIVNDVVYFGSSDGWLHGLDLKTGAVKARFQTDGSKEFSPRLVDAEGKIKSSELYTERTLDALMIGLNRMFSLGSILSSPVVSSDGVLYVGSTDGNLYALR